MLRARRAAAIGVTHDAWHGSLAWDRVAHALTGCSRRRERGARRPAARLRLSGALGCAPGLGPGSPRAAVGAQVLAERCARNRPAARRTARALCRAGALQPTTTVPDRGR